MSDFVCAVCKRPVLVRFHDTEKGFLCDYCLSSLGNSGNIKIVLDSKPIRKFSFDYTLNSESGELDNLKSPLQSNSGYSLKNSLSPTKIFKDFWSKFWSLFTSEGGNPK